MTTETVKDICTAGGLLVAPVSVISTSANRLARDHTLRHPHGSFQVVRVQAVGPELARRRNGAPIRQTVLSAAHRPRCTSVARDAFSGRRSPAIQRHLRQPAGVGNDHLRPRVQVQVQGSFAKVRNRHVPDHERGDRISDPELDAPIAATHGSISARRRRGIPRRERPLEVAR